MLGEDEVFAKIDFKNAFNGAHRRAIAAAVLAKCSNIFSSDGRKNTKFSQKVAESTKRGYFLIIFGPKSINAVSILPITPRQINLLKDVST